MFSHAIRLRRTILFSTLTAVLTGACAPSAADQHATTTAVAATVIAQITANAPTQTPTPTATLTPTPAPTKTPGPTRTPKPTKTIGPTATPRPTRTPVPGTFRNPIVIGQSGTQKSSFYNADLTITVLEVKRGKEALPIARRLQSYFYTAPLEKQEYLLAKIKVQWLTGSQTKKITTFSYGEFVLRYENDGDSLQVAELDQLAEGYVPLEADGWLQFLVREGSQPLLYVQPELTAAETLGLNTNTGLYYLLVP